MLHEMRMTTAKAPRRLAPIIVVTSVFRLAGLKGVACVTFADATVVEAETRVEMTVDAVTCSFKLFAFDLVLFMVTVPCA